VAANFNADSRFNFFALPPEAQTVIVQLNWSQNCAVETPFGPGSAYGVRIL